MKEKSQIHPNTKAWVQDRIIILGMIIMIVGAAAYIGAAKIFAPESIWLHPFKEFALLVSMIGVVSLGYELFLRELTFSEYKRALEEIVNPDAVRLGITGIYKDRSELGRAQSFEALFKGVKHEIFIGGSSLLSIATSSRDLLRTKVLNGITVKLLLMDPESHVADLIMKQGHGHSTFKSEINTSLMLFKKLQDEIQRGASSAKKGQLLVHIYDFIPSHSFIAIDSDETRGIIIADIGPYLGRNLARPSMVVVNKRNGLYEYWKEMNALMWEESKALAPRHLESPESKTKALVLVSGRETEYLDIATNTWKPASLCRENPRWRSMKGSQWVWTRDSVTLEEAKTGTQSRFRARFTMPTGAEDSIVDAHLFIRSDDTCRIFFNDVSLLQPFGGSEYPDPFIVDIAKYVRSGDNSVVFEVSNFSNPAATSPDDNPTGLIYRLHLEYKD